MELQPIDSAGVICDHSKAKINSPDLIKMSRNRGQSSFSHNPNAESTFHVQNNSQNMSNPKNLSIQNAAGDNTVPAGLQHQTILLKEVTRAFAARLLPLRVFSPAFANVPLRGTNIVNVPFYDLETAASTDWNAGNGYVAGETTTDVRSVTINKRKYGAIQVTSQEALHQPALGSSGQKQLLTLKAEKLASDIIADIMSAITAANFGAAAVTLIADLFDASTVATLRGVCNTANWPDNGRSLILNASYDAALTKDAAVSNALAFAANVAQTGAIPKISGFDYYTTNAIPSNNENLTGFAVCPGALLVAFSPIEPHPDVKAVCNYTAITDDATGISLEFRRSGNPQKDASLWTVEANYGYVLGNAAAIKRIVSA